jgi:hypothetical protein
MRSEWRAWTPLQDGVFENLPLLSPPDAATALTQPVLPFSAVVHANHLL